MISQKRFAPAILCVSLVILICLDGCAVPIAPGYSIVKETRDVEFVSDAASPELQVRSFYTLVNSGNSDLPDIQVVLPGPRAYGRTKVHAILNGQQISLDPQPQNWSSEATDAMQIALASPWHQRQKLSLEIDYSFTSPSDFGERITLASTDFHLGPRGAFPVLQPPKHFLSPFPKHPAQFVYTVRVPADFRVLSDARKGRNKSAGAQTEYRYRVGVDDLPPSIAAGRYQQSVSSGAANVPIVWAFQPASLTTPVSQQIEAAWDSLLKDFGALDRGDRVPYIIEASRLRGRVAADDEPAALAFPRGALINSAAIADGIQSDSFVDQVTRALARDWFGDRTYPAADSAVGLGEGLPEFATVILEEDRGGEPARRQRIARYLSAYDAAVRQAAESTLAVSTVSDAPGQLRIAIPKAALFFVALEDECGPVAMRAGLAQMSAVLRGQEMSYNTLRAQLEQASSKNLAPVFRLWLNEKGIPVDFRARYAGTRATGAPAN